MADRETTERNPEPPAPKGARPHSTRRSDTSGGQGQGTHGERSGKGMKAMKGNELQEKKNPTKN